MDWIFICIYYKSFTMSFEKYRTPCEKGSNHHGKDVIMICVNQECDGKRLCCLACIDELHRKHELISLYKFDSMLQILTSKQQPDVKSVILSSIKEFQQTLNKGLDRAIDNFTKSVGKCKDQIHSIVLHIQESINLDFTPEDVQILYRDFTNAKVCEFLDLIKEAESQSFKDPESTAKVLKTAEMSFDKQLFECEKQYLKGIDELNRGISKLKQLAKGSGGLKKKIFSKVNKAPCIQVTESLDEAKRFEGAGGYPIVLIDEALNENINSINVLVKEQPGNKGVWMGVCVLDIVKNFNFASCYGLNKGAWAIDQVGASHASAYSWNHHDSNYNSQPKVGWQFLTGDIINMKVDFAKSTITFSKGSLLYEMPIRTDLGDLYFFVGPTHINDIIALA